MDNFLYYLQELWQHTRVAVIAFSMAMVMSMLRTKHSTGKTDWIESVMCGLLAVGIWSCLEWWNIPQTVSVGIASGIGYFGTHWFGDFVKNRLEGKE